MKSNRIVLFITVIIGGIMSAFILLNIGIIIATNMDDGYGVYETYGRVTIVTTKKEARIDDNASNSGTTLMHNVLFCGNFGADLYVVDTNYNKMIVDIYSKNVKRISNNNELSEQDKKNFDAVYSGKCEDFFYMYDK